MFRAQKNITALASDTDYQVYYGNPAASSPPENYSNVYYFFDDFEDNSIDVNKWTIIKYSPADPDNVTEQVGEMWHYSEGVAGWLSSLPAALSQRWLLFLSSVVPQVLSYAQLLPSSQLLFLPR